MPEDVKIPGLGNVDKKYVIAGVGVGVLVAIVVYVRSKKAAQNAASSATSPALVTDPAGNQCAALDPSSGYCPNTPEDQSYQSQYMAGTSPDYGYGGTASGYGYPAGTSGAGLMQDPAGNQCATLDPLTGYCPGTPQDISAQGQLNSSGTSTTGTGTTTTGTSAPTSNAEWLTDALGVLPGGASSSNQSALASVLGGLTVTTAQKNVFMEAVGLIGNPPQSYPQPIKLSDTAAQPGTSTGGKTAGAIGVVSLLPSGSGVQAKWSAAPNATSYAWKLTGPKSQSGTTSGLVVTIHNLPKGSYNFGVQGLPGGVGNNAHATVGLWL